MFKTSSAAIKLKKLRKDHTDNKTKNVIVKKKNKEPKASKPCNELKYKRKISINNKEKSALYFCFSNLYFVAFFSNLCVINFLES